MTLPELGWAILTAYGWRWDHDGVSLALGSVIWLIASALLVGPGDKAPPYWPLGSAPE